MAVPVTWDATAPAGTDSPALGDDELRFIKQSLIDLFGFIASPSTNDWLVLQFRGDPAFLRFKDTGSSGLDFRMLNDAGVVRIQRNTGTEASPTWTDEFSLDVISQQVFS